MFALEKENECLRNEIKNQQTVKKMLLENSNDNLLLILNLWKGRKTLTMEIMKFIINNETLTLENRYNIKE